ncbi:MAG: UTP--glucose-1-phosphate uridylyltransferase GalU [Actinomycetota bacterium]
MPITKAVIPAAGLGTRFLPATKAQPKEMLPVVDKPAIQYVVEEAVRAGITDILIITGRGKRSIEDHFDQSMELERFLEPRGKTEDLAAVRAISEMADIYYVRQREPKGLGHAVACAERHVGDQPFAVLLGDDIIMDSLLSEMITIYDREGRSVLALQEVSRDEISAYGAVEAEPVGQRLVKVHGIVEKPAPQDAPSNLAVIGRYVLTPEVFDALHRTEPGVGGEIQLTDAIKMLVEKQAVYGHVFEGTRYDVGRKLDYLRATVELAAEREDLAQDFREFLAAFVVRKKLI